MSAVDQVFQSQINFVACLKIFNRFINTTFFGVHIYFPPIHPELCFKITMPQVTHSRWLLFKEIFEKT